MKPSYPVRLEAKILDAVRAIAKREKRSLKAQLEVMLSAELLKMSGQKP